MSLYKDDAGWLAVMELLLERGFELARLEPGLDDERSGRLLQFDGIFMRPSESLA